MREPAFPCAPAIILPEAERLAVLPQPDGVPDPAELLRLLLNMFPVGPQ